MSTKGMFYMQLFCKPEQLQVNLHLSVHTIDELLNLELIFIMSVQVVHHNISRVKCILCSQLYYMHAGFGSPFHNNIILDVINIKDYAICWSIKVSM